MSMFDKKVNPLFSREKDGDAMAPQWVHRNSGRNRAERRELARKRRSLTAPATNRPYRKGEGRDDG